jgi:hypothetical protein
MKVYITLFSIVFIATSCNSQQLVKAKNKIVIELFTSEGCSSCPAAEKYLGALSKEDTNVILLSFHVDYWNKLGWTDTFSNNQFTQRQYDYGNRFKLSSVYTPQAIINGTKETTGSNANKIQQYIQQTAFNPQMLIGTVSTKIDNNKIIVSASNKSNDANILYETFLVEKNVSTHIMAGENEGATLPHTNVVRSFMQSSSITNISLTWLNKFQQKNFEIVIVARDKNSYAVKDVAVKTL